MTSMDHELESGDFIARLQAGDEAAFASLVKHYHARLLGFAGSLGGSQHAEEILQEDWVSIWRNLSGFAGRSQLKTWLYTIVRNECSRRLQREARLPTINIEEELHSDGIDGWLAARFAAEGHWQGGQTAWSITTPEGLLEEKQLQDCLDHHMAALQTTQRAVFRMRDLEQMELDEICNILEISSSNVRVLLHRARLKLLQVIDHYQETGEC